MLQVNYLSDLNAQLTDVLLSPLYMLLVVEQISDPAKIHSHLVLVSLPSLVQREDLFVNNGMNIVGLNSSNHIPHESFATNIYTTDSTDV